MTTPRPGLLFHFTHLSNLASIAVDGLAPDAVVRVDGRLQTEVGNQGIKDARRSRGVPCGPGGCVADYVPFYFSTRSPMLYAIRGGNVATYQGGQADLVYLVSEVGRVVELGLPYVFTDRNAVLAFASFSDNLDDLDDFVDWNLMNETYWHNTAQEPDRRERRMAEFLVHGTVPWDAFLSVGTFDDARSDQVTDLLSSVGVEADVLAKRDWYF